MFATSTVVCGNDNGQKCRASGRQSPPRSPEEYRARRRRRPFIKPRHPVHRSGPGALATTAARCHRRRRTGTPTHDANSVCLRLRARRAPVFRPSARPKCACPRDCPQFGISITLTNPDQHGNDPSAGSPTETLLRLLLPLDDQV